MKAWEEDDGLRWSEPELSQKVKEERPPAKAQQMLAAGGLVIAMDVANVIAERWNR